MLRSRQRRDLSICAYLLVEALCCECFDIAFQALQIIDIIETIHHVVLFIAVDLERFGSAALNRDCLFRKIYFQLHIRVGLDGLEDLIEEIRPRIQVARPVADVSHRIGLDWAYLAGRRAFLALTNKTED